MLVDKVQIKMQCIELVICAFSILFSLKWCFELPCSRARRSFISRLISRHYDGELAQVQVDGDDFA